MPPKPRVTWSQYIFGNYGAPASEPRQTREYAPTYLDDASAAASRSRLNNAGGIDIGQLIQSARTGQWADLADGLHNALSAFGTHNAAAPGPQALGPRFGSARDWYPVPNSQGRPVRAVPDLNGAINWPIPRDPGNLYLDIGGQATPPDHPLMRLADRARRLGADPPAPPRQHDAYREASAAIRRGLPGGFDGDPTLAADVARLGRPRTAWSPSRVLDAVRTMEEHGPPLSGKNFQGLPGMYVRGAGASQQFLTHPERDDETTPPPFGPPVPFNGALQWPWPQPAAPATNPKRSGRLVPATPDNLPSDRRGTYRTTPADYLDALHAHLQNTRPRSGGAANLSSEQWRSLAQTSMLGAEPASTMGLFARGPDAEIVPTWAQDQLDLDHGTYQPFSRHDDPRKPYERTNDYPNPHAATIGSYNPSWELWRNEEGKLVPTSDAIAADAPYRHSYATSKDGKRYPVIAPIQSVSVDYNDGAPFSTQGSRNAAAKGALLQQSTVNQGNVRPPKASSGATPEEKAAAELARGEFEDGLNAKYKRAFYPGVLADRAGIKHFGVNHPEIPIDMAFPIAQRRIQQAGGVGLDISTPMHLQPPHIQQALSGMLQQAGLDERSATPIQLANYIQTQLKQKDGLAPILAAVRTARGGKLGDAITFTDPISQRRGVFRASQQRPGTKPWLVHRPDVYKTASKTQTDPAPTTYSDGSPRDTSPPINQGRGALLPSPANKPTELYKETGEGPWVVRGTKRAVRYEDRARAEQIAARTGYPLHYSPADETNPNSIDAVMQDVVGAMSPIINNRYLRPSPPDFLTRHGRGTPTAPPAPQRPGTIRDSRPMSGEDDIMPRGARGVRAGGQRRPSWAPPSLNKSWTPNSQWRKTERSPEISARYRAFVQEARRIGALSTEDARGELATTPEYKALLGKKLMHHTQFTALPGIQESGIVADITRNPTSYSTYDMLKGNALHNARASFFFPEGEEDRGRLPTSLQYQPLARLSVPADEALPHFDPWAAKRLLLHHAAGQYKYPIRNGLSQLITARAAGGVDPRAGGTPWAEIALTGTIPPELVHSEDLGRPLMGVPTSDILDLYRRKAAEHAPLRTARQWNNQTNSYQLYRNPVPFIDPHGEWLPDAPPEPVLDPVEHLARLKAALRR